MNLRPENISMVAAVARNGVIGNNNLLPWRIPSDLARFRSLTLDHAVLMGYSTWESIPEKYRPLPNRLNIVLSQVDQRRGALALHKGVISAANMSNALDIWRHSEYADKELMVIGGARVYQQALPLANRLYITWVNCTPEGDAHFPFLCHADWSAGKFMAVNERTKDDQFQTAFQVLERSYAIDSYEPWTGNFRKQQTETV